MEKQNVVTLMRKHMDNNGLQDWEIGFKNSKKILATCYHSKRQIKMSKPFYEINDCKRVTKTVLHEIGHAILGSGHGHGEMWKRTCRKIGLDNPSKFADTKDIIKPPPKYTGKCECGKQNFRVERKRKRNGHCALCIGEISWVETKTGTPINFNVNYNKLYLV